MEDYILNAVSNFGFPAVFCIYIMARVVKAVDKNTTAIDALREDIQRLLHK